MGHLVGKDLYRRLGKKIDNLTMRAPWNGTLYKILKELYLPDEADLAVRMPYGMATLDQIALVSGYNHDRLKSLLEKMAAKGLVLDVEANGRSRYILSPFVIGIFEFTMMRTGEDADHKKMAGLFNEYLADRRFYEANLKAGQIVSPLRTLPHEGTIETSDYVEVLAYEKATAIVENAGKYAIGICSCRHEKFHVGEKKCDIPLETCSSFDGAADYLIRHDFAREVSKTEMLELLAKSKEMGLVFCADNVQKDITFICHCCGCCCNILLGISRFGYPNMVVTSNYIAESNAETCSGCGTCAETCPIKAIELLDDNSPEIDSSICIGCGVCALKCETESMKLTRRKQKVLHPETTFEKIILQCLEKGTLQNFVFNNPQNIGHSFMRGFVGAFLKLPPVKKALMSDMLRSRFLNAMNRAG
jgi:ferredoxin